MKIAYFFIKTFFRISSALFPDLAGKRAMHLFQQPHFKKNRSREEKLYEEFQEKRIPFKDEDLFIYTQGDSNAYPVILVHGWDSNPGSMYAIADALVQNKYNVTVIGLPAHGRSKLKKTNMVHASQAIKALLDVLELKENFSMVTHSFGSGASALALVDSDIKVDKLIFLSSPDQIGDIFEEFAQMISLGDKAYKVLTREVEKLLSFSVKEFNISDFLQRVKYNNLSIIQDQKDKVLPWKNALQIKEKNKDANLFPMQDKGHYRLLWDKEVVRLVLKLLKK